MFPILTMLWANKYARYAMLAVALAGAALGVRAHYVHVGVQQGKEQAAAEATKDAAQQIQQLRDSTVAQLHQADQRVAAAQAEFNAAQGREATLARQVAALGARRQAGADKVAALGDPELHQYSVQVMQLRPAGDVTPGYTAAEERRIAQLVTDYPLLRDTAAKQEGQLGELRGQVANLQGQVKDVAAKQATLAAYTVRLEGAYVQAYNALPRKRNWLLTIVTVGVKGKPKKLTVPDPKELFKQGE